MYGWIWERLPGSPVTRGFLAAVLVAAVVAVLWFVVFPVVDSLLPYTAVDVRLPGPEAGDATVQHNGQVHSEQTPVMNERYTLAGESWANL